MYQEIELPKFESKFIKWAEQEEGATFKGIYLGVDTSGKYLSHKLQVGDKTLWLNGCAKLNKYLAVVPVGAEVTIKYLGTKPIDGGSFKGVQSHTFTVGFDNGDEKPAGVPF